MTDDLKQRIIKTLTWMIADARWRSDESRNNIEEGSHGGYSDELQEAIDLLEELNK